MQNLYTAKNPFMSLWLSAANTYLNTANGLVSAEMQRQQQAMMQQALDMQQDMMKQWVDLSMRIWFPWMSPPRR
jgi:hypothetical protein